MMNHDKSIPINKHLTNGYKWHSSVLKKSLLGVLLGSQSVAEDHHPEELCIKWEYHSLQQKSKRHMNTVCARHAY